MRAMRSRTRAIAKRMRSSARSRVINDLKQRGVHGDVINKAIGQTYGDTDEVELAKKFLERKRVRHPEGPKDYCADRADAVARGIQQSQRLSRAEPVEGGTGSSVGAGSRGGGDARKAGIRRTNERPSRNRDRASLEGRQETRQADRASARLARSSRTISQNVFEALMESIVYQQLSGKAAATILNRVKALYFPPDTPTHDTRHGKALPFPTPRTASRRHQMNGCARRGYRATRRKR